MKKLILLITLLNTTLVLAQSDWNWPEEEEMFNLAQEKQAYYKVLMGQDKYLEALDALQWLYDNNANLNPSIYIDGSKCAEKVMDGNEDQEQISSMRERSLWMYDQRIKHFGKEASVMDRKAYTAFKYYYKTPKKYPLLFELYEKAYDLNKGDISDFNLTPYMTAAKYGFGWKLIDAEMVLDIHGTISEAMDIKEASGQDMTSYRDKVDGLLKSIKGVLTCEFIEEKLVPRFENNPDDLGTAKKIVVYSVDAKCTDQDYFLDAGEKVIENEPEYKFCMIIADKRYANGEYVNAGELYDKAAGLASSNEHKFDAMMGKAKVAAKRGQKNSARGMARQALTYKPGSAQVFNFVGNLYFQSFEDCAGYESQLDDRLVYLAAYDQFKKAGNTSRMAAAKEQFPSIEDIFTAGKKEGDEMSVGCWIGETVTLTRR